MKLGKFIIINVISMDAGTWKRIDGLSLAGSIRKLVSVLPNNIERNIPMGQPKLPQKPWDISR